MNQGYRVLSEDTAGLIWLGRQSQSSIEHWIMFVRRCCEIERTQKL